MHILIYGPIYTCRYVNMDPPIYIYLFPCIYRYDVCTDIYRYIPIFTDKHRYIGRPTGGLDGWSAVFFVSFMVFVSWTLLQVLFPVSFIFVVGWPICNLNAPIYMCRMYCECRWWWRCFWTISLQPPTRRNNARPRY